MINKFKKLLIYVINIPLYGISKLIQKDENIWIFGSWFGEKYADNSKYLFEYVNKHHPEIRAVWLTNNTETHELLKSKKYEVYKTYSLNGYLCSAKAKFSFVCTDFSDVNKFIPAKIIINLWHGNPLKKVVYDDTITLHLEKYKFKRFIVKKIFPFINRPEHFNYIIASSLTESLNLSSAFKIDITKVLVTGLPRNDVFKHNNSKKIKKIIYMPTHRNEGEMDITSLFINDIELINNYLKKFDIELYIKLHFYHMQNMNLIEYSNVKLLQDDDINQDIYSVMNNFDLLITDYSSIYFDYLLTDRPIIFSAFDYEEYIQNDRELYYDYNEVTPGPKCKNWNEILEWIVKFKENPRLYGDERERVKNRFHRYQDSKSCERVYNTTSSLIV